MKMTKWLITWKYENVIGIWNEHKDCFKFWCRIHEIRVFVEIAKIAFSIIHIKYASNDIESLNVEIDLKVLRQIVLNSWLKYTIHICLCSWEYSHFRANFHAFKYTFNEKCFSTDTFSRIHSFCLCDSSKNLLDHCIKLHSIQEIWNFIFHSDTESIFHVIITMAL